MKQNILILTFTIFGFLANGQEKTLFHSYSPTASSWKIIERNIRDTTNVIWVLKEIVDEKGRVKELQFLKNGKLISDHLCYLANRVTFAYQPNKIIEELFWDSTPPIANECDINCKTVYHLTNNHIDSLEMFHCFDTENYTEEEVNNAKRYAPERFTFICNDSTNTEIDYYYHSYAKLNGIYPVNNGYKFKDKHYYYDREPVNTEILNGINKNNR